MNAGLKELAKWFTLAARIIIQNKIKLMGDAGFEPLPFIAPLFDWQKITVAWAVKKGRCALFEECGLGKTIQQLEIARQIVGRLLSTQQEFRGAGGRIRAR